MKKLVLAALSAAALMSFACASASAYTSRKTGFIEFEEFADLTSQRNTMDYTYTVFSGYTRCMPVSQTITSDRYGSNCYIGGSAIDTVQLTVPGTNTNEVQIGNHNSLSVSRRLALNTGELTVRSTTTSEFKGQLNNSTSSDCSESSTSTIGTDEGTQLKARLA